MQNAEPTRGQRIAERMGRLGIKKTDLVAEARVARNTLYRALADAPTTEETTWRAIELALDRLEDEAWGGADAIMSTEAGIVSFEVVGDFGVRVTVKGPIENAQQLEASVSRLIRDIRDGNSDRSD